MSFGSFDGYPHLSIVTPCVNRVGFIAEAVESVLRQDYPCFEHIVVDGGSTDGTLDVLGKYGHLRVVSESDRGVYDALNKGIRMARGEIIGHLNSDDLYEDGIFPEVARGFATNPELDAIYGGAGVFEDPPGGGRRTLAEYVIPADPAQSLRAITLGIPIINARFFRRRVYDGVGLYDDSYRIAADREFLLRVEAAGLRALHLPRRVYWYRQHSGSLTISEASPHRHEMLTEYLRIAEEHLDRAGVSADVKRLCRTWHRREAAEGIMLSLREKRFLGAMRYWLRGWRQDGWWPLAVLALVLPRAAGWLSRRWHGRG
jgi:glycosyltransferase involved in cell wall biosynthesis